MRVDVRFACTLHGAGEPAPVGTEAAPAGEDWAEERIALEAIYAADAAFPSERRTVLALDGGLVLDVRLVAGGAYPRDPPVLALRHAPATCCLSPHFGQMLHLHAVLMVREWCLACPAGPG